MFPLTRKELERIFEKLDTNSDGYLSLEELKRLLDKTGFKLTIEELESLVGKKSLDLSDFLFFCEATLKQNNDDDVIVEAFKVFDLDGDGFITCQELECVLKRLGMLDKCSGKDCRTMIYSYDTNFDGKLDFQEFKNMMLLSLQCI